MQPGIGQQAAEIGGGMIQQVALKHLDPFIPRRSNIAEGAVHLAKGAIGQTRDRGHPDSIAPKRAPAIGVIGQFPIRHLPAACSPQACATLGQPNLPG